MIDFGDKNALDIEDIEKLIKILIGAENAAGINKSDMKMIVDKVIVDFMFKTNF